MGSMGRQSGSEPGQVLEKIRLSERKSSLRCSVTLAQEQCEKKNTLIPAHELWSSNESSPRTHAIRHATRADTLSSPHEPLISRSESRGSERLSTFLAVKLSRKDSGASLASRQSLNKLIPANELWSQDSSPETTPRKIQRSNAPSPRESLGQFSITYLRLSESNTDSVSGYTRDFRTIARPGIATVFFAIGASAG